MAKAQNKNSKARQAVCSILERFDLTIELDPQTKKEIADLLEGKTRCKQSRETSELPPTVAEATIREFKTTRKAFEREAELTLARLAIRKLPPVKMPSFSQGLPRLAVVPAGKGKRAEEVQPPPSRLFLEINSMIQRLWDLCRSLRDLWKRIWEELEGNYIASENEWPIDRKED